MDSFHPPHTKGLKVLNERVRHKKSEYGGCVDGAVISITMETMVELSHVIVLIWAIFTPFIGKLVLFNILLMKENIIFHIFSI